MKVRTALLSVLLSSVIAMPGMSFSKLEDKIAELSKQVEEKVIAWRHDFHQYPELSNREFKTAEKIATHLKSIGIDLQTDVAHTGVVGLLRVGKPGPVVALLHYTPGFYVDDSAMLLGVQTLSQLAVDYMNRK